MAQAGTGQDPARARPRQGETQPSYLTAATRARGSTHLAGCMHACAYMVPGGPHPERVAHLIVLILDRVAHEVLLRKQLLHDCVVHRRDRLGVVGQECRLCLRQSRRAVYCGWQRGRHAARRSEKAGRVLWAVAMILRAVSGIGSKPLAKHDDGTGY
eukprot:146061-Chlamydomonas_euryale.AAC.2